MDQDDAPRSRLLPPDPVAIRAAQQALRKPRLRGLPILVIAVAAGFGTTLLGRGPRPDAASPGASVAGLFEVRALASLPAAREAEAVVVARYSTSDDVVAGLADRREAARIALTRWLAERRPSVLVDDAERDVLRADLEAALFPARTGAVEAVVMRSLRLR